jgi:hypothetical protein
MYTPVGVRQEKKWAKHRVVVGRRVRRENARFVATWQFIASAKAPPPTSWVDHGWPIELSLMDESRDVMLSITPSDYRSLLANSCDPLFGLLNCHHERGRDIRNSICCSVMLVIELDVSVYLTPYLAGCMTALGTATVHLLTAILLVCPYLCLSNAATGTDASSTRVHHSAGCDCCSRSVPQDSQDSENCPDQPDSRQGSGTCLCHGAVMDRHIEMFTPDHAVVVCLPSGALVLAAEPFGQDDQLVTQRAACHFPAAESGREVRALIASLLL